MNIAILIGISKYKNAAHLPACVADVNHMRRVLEATTKYEEIRCLTEQTNSGSLKDALREFFAEYRNQNTPPLTEVLVYFSGHGIYYTDALLCCSDFDADRPETTSISNVELDDLLRSVSPKVAVKIIDACQSGSPYIKDASAGFEKALGTSRLQSFICMASSRLDQSSYATAEASAFTAKWIDAALYKQDGVVLYRDIQASLADAFRNTPEQTPFFVSQGTGLEQFSAVTNEMKQLATKRYQGLAVATPEDNLSAILSAEIARLDELYIPPETASKSVEKAGQELENEVISEPLVAHFYAKRVTLGTKLNTLPRAHLIADFAQEQGWSKNYFVRIGTEEVRVRVAKNPLATAWHLMYKAENEDDYVIERRTRPANLEATQNLPFEVAEVTFQANNHPSLKAFILYIGIVHSLTDVMVLSAVVRLMPKGWETRLPELSGVQWQYQSYLWKDVAQRPKVLWEDAMRQGEVAIRAYLEGLTPKTEPPQPDDSSIDAAENR